MKKINVTSLEGLKWEASPSGSILLTDASFEEQTRMEEFFRGSLLSAIDEAVGAVWRIDFKELRSSQVNKRGFDTNIVAPNFDGYKCIERIILERATTEYVLLGRYSEDTAVTNMFYMHDSSILHFLLEYEGFNELPSDFLYAAMIC